jgi:hypothetical protein
MKLNALFILANVKQRNKSSVMTLQTGQLWRVEDSNLQITHVGKRLIHYQRTKGQTKRSPIRMSAKLDLEKYLKEHGGVLLRSD